jgi:Rrf2 family protein
MSEGVEWATHCCLLLDWLGDADPVPTAELAAAFEIPAPYLNKQLQALVRAGILTSTRGKRGGFALARPLDRITLLDVVDAIEGADPAFRCTEIRRCGLGAGTPNAAYRAPCDVAAAMHAAEAEWREALAARTLAGVRQSAERRLPHLGGEARRWYADRRG